MYAGLTGRPVLYTEPINRPRVNIRNKKKRFYYLSAPDLSIMVPTAQGKQGKWPNKFPVREKTGNLEMLSKHREFCQNTGKHGEFC